MSSVRAALPLGVKSESNELSRPSDWSRFGLPALLVLCAVLPYANTLFNGFVHDDNRQVVLNPYIRNFHHLPEIFGTTVWSFIGAQGVTNYYRPIMTFGYLLSYQLFGQLAYGFHLANILLHAGVVLILYWLTGQLFRNRTLAGIAAAVFALHPIHSESVAWIAAVTDLELTFFYLITFGSYVALARSGGGRSDRAQLLMVASFILTTLSKEQALTLPVLATVYEHFYRDDRDQTTLAQKAARYGALWLLALAYVLFRIRFLGALAPVLQLSTLTPSEAFLSGIALVGQYWTKLFWPAHLCAFYVFRKSTTVSDPRVLAGIASLVLCAILFAGLWKTTRIASFGLLWIFATLAPVLNPRWMAANVFTERYLYLPSVGFGWLVAFGWTELDRRFQGRRLPVWRLAQIAACCIAIVAIARIVTRNRDWRTDVVLFTRTLEASPDALQIRNNLGVVYWDRGDMKAAEREWREALRVAPKNAIVLNNLALLAQKQKKYNEAVELFRQAMRLKPNYTDPHLNLGDTYAEMGLDDEAALQFRAAVALSPLNSRAHNEWGKFLLKARQLQEAEEQYRLSVESTPNSVGYDALGDIGIRLRHDNQAERAFRGALTLDAFDSHAHFGLGALYAKAGRNAEAVREYQAGLISDPTNPDALAAVRRFRSELSHAKP